MNSIPERCSRYLRAAYLGKKDGLALWAWAAILLLNWLQLLLFKPAYRVTFAVYLLVGLAASALYADWLIPIFAKER